MISSHLVGRVLGATTALSLLAGAVAVSPLAAQSTQSTKPPQIIRTPSGKEVEVIGLRRWTVQMIQDSLDRYSPGDSLQKHSCAAVLRYTLGFADAAATTLELTPTSERVIVTVREPQDSARVHYRAVALDTADRRKEWESFTRLLQARPDLPYTLPRLIATRGADTTAPSDSATTAAFRFVRSHASKRNLQQARQVLASSPNYVDRTAAVLILANALDDDAIARTMIETMRETDGWAKGTAASVLSASLRARPRTVDWRPVAPAIHALLDGTNLFGFFEIAEILQRSGVGPRDAAALLGGGGGEMVTDYLASKTSLYATTAHALLVQLRGADLGPDSAPWREWIASLPAPAKRPSTSSTR